MLVQASAARESNCSAPFFNKYLTTSKRVVHIYAQVTCRADCELIEKNVKGAGRREEGGEGATNLRPLSRMPGGTGEVVARSAFIRHSLVCALEVGNPSKRSFRIRSNADDNARLQPSSTRCRARPPRKSRPTTRDATETGS